MTQITVTIVAIVIKTAVMTDLRSRRFRGGILTSVVMPSSYAAMCVRASDAALCGWLTKNCMVQLAVE